MYDYDKDQARVYINGVAQDLLQNGTSSGTTASLPRDANPLSGNANAFNIGRRADGTYYFKGKISDVRFWNIARTAEQIAADKNKKLNGDEAGLVGYWKLDETTGTVANDSTVNNNLGTLMNGITKVQEPEAVNKGGLIGYNAGTVSNSYYDTEISGQSDTGKGVPKTTVEMKQETTFNTGVPATTWDFAAIWGLTSAINNSYPYLLSTSKNITGFSFAGLAPVVTGLVNEGAKTITLTLPSGTVVTSLVPTIVHTGASVSPASGAAQDFTNPVTYTVTAADGSTQAYVVNAMPEFAGGNGEVGNPYQITKLEQLNNIKKYLGKSFILMNDLDFSVDADYQNIENKTTWTTGRGGYLLAQVWVTSPEALTAADIQLRA